MLFSVRWQRIYAHAMFLKFILVFIAARRLSIVAARGLLIVVASLVVEHGL